MWSSQYGSYSSYQIVASGGTGTSYWYSNDQSRYTGTTFPGFVRVAAIKVDLCYGAPEGIEDTFRTIP